MHDPFSEYKIIFFLSCIVVITTIIGEFARIESLKEGMDFGGLITMFLKLVLCFFQFIMMIFQIIFWLINCAFTWLPLFLVWLIQFGICALTKLLNIPNCFLWYGMEIAGKIIYLPFRITFYILDYIFSLMKVNFSIQGLVNQIWWFIDDMDHSLYNSGSSGFHFVHFPDEVVERCYRCKIGNAPPIPDFPLDAVMSFASCIG